MDEGHSNKSTNGTVTYPGVAAVKSQYLSTKDTFHEYLNNGRKKDLTLPNSLDEEVADDVLKHESKKVKIDQSDKDTNESEKSNVELCQSKDNCKQSKRKARGQNKNRPHMKPNQYEHDQKLCSSVFREPPGECYYGEKCRFLHDVSKYLAQKPADLGDHCYLYDTYGRCQYGISCRYAQSHIGPDNNNLINEDLMKTWETKVMVKNTLSKELQHILRKKKFPFPKSEQYLKRLSVKQKSCKQDSLEENESGKHHSEEKPDSTKVITGMAVEINSAVSVSNAVVKENYLASNDNVIPHLLNTFACPGSKLEENTTPSTGIDAAVDGSVNDDKQISSAKRLGVVTDEDIIKLRSCEKKQLNFRDKLYLAPLTTCGNLPFRRICKQFGADITCGEMAVCTNLLQGQSSEWALLKRHHTEDIFGVQLEGAFPDTMTKCAELLNQTIDVDFVDINVGCPIDLVYQKGAGCGLMNRVTKLEQIVKGMNSVLDVPVTAKLRTGIQEKVNIAHKLIPSLRNCGLSMVTLHGRSREQRYSKLADWDYIDHCAQLAKPMLLFGNGDILSFEDANRARATTAVSGVMVARGALIKPWIFTEIKEQRHWDISSKERFEILQDYSNYGLEHWGSDTQGVEKCRRFLLEWLSFLCRYIPVGLLEHVPQKINERPPYYLGRDYLETLMSSQNACDWIKISEMLLGPVPPNFTFVPKHKANSYK
ncbi:tRNA-dihydrouridine(47) synthase [NAD(P)(+)]-like isoform X1 [Hypanus sabinus]|uniref:tRNA-dihydrouridine(47) synthase [NAD(P)(+)]-like isoform X1 n=1 Tax=Hypanus sabinus TaxID=79690 RepID=UPI0028C43B53|nr:tRNA-dihydrouridine(47) synthase [NAD(P)(+)]-like isoform X1 [Hypanus sabinus]